MKTKVLFGSAILVAALAGLLLGGHFKSSHVQPATISEGAAAVTVDSTNGTAPMSFNCDEGRIVVTPVVQNGQKRYELTCTPQESSGEAVPAVYRRYSNNAPVYENVSSRRRPYPEDSRYQRHRSWERHALIIGGSALGGTAIGGIAGGRKGAAIGAASGGVAGLIYDLATKKRR